MQDEQVLKNVLSFSNIHKSITNLEQVELPGFVVLTGVNGSGKTHLLEAIQNGKVVSSLIANTGTDVRSFTSSSIVPIDTGLFDPASLKVHKNNWFQSIESHRANNFVGLQNFAMQQGVPLHLCSSIEKLTNLTEEKLNDHFGEGARGNVIYSLLQQQMAQIGHNIGHQVMHHGDDLQRKSALRIIENEPINFFTKSRSEFYSHPSFIWGEIDLFQQSFAQIFTSYRTLLRDNLIRFKRYPDKYLSDEKFTEVNGIPPWDFVNQILSSSNLDFQIDSPPIDEDWPYEPKLRKISKDVEMRFTDLSSGEKVLMSFALCLYNTKDNRQSKSFPKLLLLDEVDAPLHPSMAKSLINTIQKVLVEGQKIAVILTTHSPSTVALAPDASLYEMNPTGPCVNKVSKSKALSLLTSGVPTLSVDYSGRRQVFVESNTDAKLFDLIFQKYKEHLSPERSLTFIAVGHERNGGCDQVKRIVNELHTDGNQSVLGLIDWDGKNIPIDGIKVLCQGVRDGMESVILDPLLISAALVRIDPNHANKIKLIDQSESYAALLLWDTSKWQIAIDLIQDMVLGKSETNSIEIEYLSGLKLNVRTAYLQMDDHMLEEKITNSFPPLKAYSRRRGELCEYIFEHVLSDSPNLVPKDLLQSLDALLTHDFSK